MKRDHRRRVWLLRGVLLLFLGAVTAVIFAWAMSYSADLLEAAPQSWTEVTGETSWTLTRWDRAGGVLVQSVREVGFAWSPMQAAGPPDTATAGDQRTAWASATTDAQPEWLELEYARAVAPAAVEVHETYNPGALAKVSVFDAQGKEVPAWEGDDPGLSRASMGKWVSRVPVGVEVQTRRVKLYIDSPKVGGWNEIDAVALVGRDGSRQWATKVEASSWYNSQAYANSSSGGVPVEAVPSWGGLARPGHALQDEGARSEQRLVEGRGWPMIAVWGERDPAVLATAPMTGTLTFSTRLALTGGGTVRIGAAGMGLRGQPLFHVVPAGLAVDAVVYAVILGLIWWALVWPRRFVVEVARMRRGCCLRCGYDLRYDFVKGCPECGWGRMEPTAIRTASRSGV